MGWWAKRRRGRRVLLYGAFLWAPTAVAAQDLPAGTAGDPTVPAQVTLEDTEVRFLSSRANGIEYRLWVALPKGHDTEGASFPVVYLLDADYSFALARNIAIHLGDRGHLRPVIMVGVGYAGAPRYRTNRTRDYTPVHRPDGGYGPAVHAASGGGPRFMDFIADELIPFVEAEYAASDERVLVGHSYGGLFGAWVLVTRPGLFRGYVLVSPSLWYAEHMVMELERVRAAQDRDLTARVFLTVGDQERNRERDMVADLTEFARRLAEGPYPGLALRWSVEEGETHNSIFPTGLSDGLRFVLQGR